MYQALASVLSILLFLFPVESRCAFCQQTVQVTNSEIIRMLKAGLPESVILEEIKTSSGQLDTSPDALIALKQAGASADILSVVLKHSGQVGSSDGKGAPTTLEANIKSIQDSLNEHGQAVYILYAHEYRSGKDYKFNETDRMSDVHLDAVTCQFSSKKTVQYNGQTENYSPAVNFKEADEVLVRTLEEDFKINDAATDDAKNSYRADPPAYVLVLRRAGKTIMSGINLSDLSLANSVAQSMANAAQLCQGGDRNVKLTLGVANEAIAYHKTPPPADTALNDNTLPPNDVDSSALQPATTGYNQTAVNINNGSAPANPQKAGTSGSAAQATGPGSTGRFTNAIPQCTGTQYDSQNGGALWIVNKCNIAVVVQWTSDSGNSWGEVNIRPGGRDMAGQSGIGYSRRDGRIYLYTCPKDSTPVLPNGDPFIPRTYKGPYNCALP